MTCRLLCALLVLALCCCPSVCVTADVDGKSDNSGGHSGLKENETEEPKQVTDPQSTLSPLSKVSEVVKLTAESQGDRIQEQEEEPTNEEADGGETDNAKDQNQKTNAINTTTTTTTTQPPTTTTTTTQAPSTKTTEAPTTTTTRAPSRLREIDGSLSSSAWVCAPLLLAASALAYTTLG
ncbi:mucin TcMUCII [Trypanosoma cruzi]|nr:mucin TcMUCII [Trypanosoma cruzi]